MIKKNTNILFLLLVLLGKSVVAQVFTEESTNLDNFAYPSMDWADYDADGDMDLVISGAVDTSGDQSPDTSTIALYNNDNGVLTEVETPEIYGLHLGFVKFMDIDNDGDLDLLANGQNYNNIFEYNFTVYENTGSGFVEKQELEGMVFASVDVGDYDNDGDLDILVSGAYQSSEGASSLTRIYTNEAGTFAQANIELPAVQNGNAQFGDFDNDTDLDIIIMGLDSDGNNIMEIYTNEAGSFTLGQTFPGISYGSLALEDFDADGDVDIAVIGNDVNYDYTTIIYENVAGSFSEYTTLTGLDNFSGTNPIAWGDYDNDGDFDLILSGDDADYNENTLLYKNTDNTFALVDEGVQNVGGGTSLSWVDFDGDNDLDVAVSGFIVDSNDDYVLNTTLLKNEISTQNLKPEAPQNLRSEFVADNTISFTWDSAIDDHTPAEALRYFITIGTTENGSEIAAYEIKGTTWTLKNATENNYYWSVQAIDGANVYSDKENEQVLGIESFVAESGFKMYPNPTKDKRVTITFAGDNYNANNTSITIQTITGGTIRNIEIPRSLVSNKTIDLSALQSGVYMVNVTSGKNTITKKLILK